MPYKGVSLNSLESTSITLRSQTVAKQDLIERPGPIQGVLVPDQTKTTHALKQQHILLCCSGCLPSSAGLAGGSGVHSCGQQSQSCVCDRGERPGLCRDCGQAIARRVCSATNWHKDSSLDVWLHQKSATATLSCTGQPMACRTLT